MSNQISVRFDAAEFEKQLRALGSAEAQKIIAMGVTEGTAIVAAEARRMAPDSGLSPGSPRKIIRGKKHSHKLKNEIETRRVKVTDTGLIARIVARPFYGMMVERGQPARGIEANPFFRKAASSKRQQAVEAVQEYVRRAVEAAFR